MCSNLIYNFKSYLDFFPGTKNRFRNKHKLEDASLNGIELQSTATISTAIGQENNDASEETIVVEQ